MGSGDKMLNMVHISHRQELVVFENSGMVLVRSGQVHMQFNRSKLFYMCA